MTFWHELVRELRSWTIESQLKVTISSLGAVNCSNIASHTVWVCFKRLPVPPRLKYFLKGSHGKILATFVSVT